MKIENINGNLYLIARVDDAPDMYPPISINHELLENINVDGLKPMHCHRKII